VVCPFATVHIDMELRAAAWRVGRDVTVRVRRGKPRGHERPVPAPTSRVARAYPTGFHRPFEW